ncbi:MAG: DUF5615 family PIN-like protein [Acidobacteriia bacterium]|nr:DUF5615 family PIN-like protein [Terriglobia bacterium]
MKVLFDHNLPYKLRTELGALSTHEIITASYMGWRELNNGELLRAADENNFEVFVTGDQTLVYEQNLSARRLAIVALSANNWPIIKDYLFHILTAIDSATPGTFQLVDCGAFSRKKPRAR